VDRKTQGLFVRGTVVRRSKRFVGADEAEIVTYGVNVGNAVVDVDDWRPEAYFDVGTEIDVAITVRAFTNKAGRVCVSLTRFRGEKGAF
jgi:hypothetical protein